MVATLSVPGKPGFAFPSVVIGSAALESPRGPARDVAGFCGCCPLWCNLCHQHPQPSRSGPAASPNRCLRGFIGCRPQGAGTSVFLSSPAVLPPSPTAPSFRPIAAADLPLWPGDLAAVLAPTINSRANNGALHQSTRQRSEQEQMASSAVGYGGQGQAGRLQGFSRPPPATRPGCVFLRPMDPLNFQRLGPSSPILPSPSPQHPHVLVDVASRSPM